MVDGTRGSRDETQAQETQAEPWGKAAEVRTEAKPEGRRKPKGWRDESMTKAHKSMVTAER